jgi:hypothetical protein
VLYVAALVGVVMVNAGGTRSRRASPSSTADVSSELPPQAAAHAAAIHTSAVSLRRSDFIEAPTRLHHRF